MTIVDSVTRLWERASVAALGQLAAVAGTPAPLVLHMPSRGHHSAGLKCQFSHPFDGAKSKRTASRDGAEEAKACVDDAAAVAAAIAVAGARTRDKSDYGVVPDGLVRRVLRQFRVVARRGPKVGVHPEVGSDLLQWTVRLTGFRRDAADSKESLLASDLDRWHAARGDGGAEPGITLCVRFPPLYPAVAPHIRVVRPQFQFRTGHVTLGGIVCLEKLGRTSAWDPETKLLPLLLEVKMTMIEGGGRLMLYEMEDYSEHDAQEAWKRMKRTHGWD